MDFKSFYEPGGALRGQNNLENCTWADFKSLYKPGGALRGPKILKIATPGAWGSSVGGEGGVENAIPRGGEEEGKEEVLRRLVTP